LSDFATNMIYSGRYWSLWGFSDTTFWKLCLCLQRQRFVLNWAP